MLWSWLIFSEAGTYRYIKELDIELEIIK